MLNSGGCLGPGQLAELPGFTRFTAATRLPRIGAAKAACSIHTGTRPPFPTWLDPCITPRSKPAASTPARTAPAPLRLRIDQPICRSRQVRGWQRRPEHTARAKYAGLRCGADQEHTHPRELECGSALGGIQRCEPRLVRPAKREREQRKRGLNHLALWRSASDAICHPHKLVSENRREAGGQKFASPVLALPSFVSHLYVH